MTEQNYNDNDFYVNDMFFNENINIGSADRNSQQEIFKNNCGNLSANINSKRKDFIKNNSKIRFLVVGLGLQGSGKTSGFDNAREYCKRLNFDAFENNEWVRDEVSHDYQVATNSNYKIAVRKLFQKTKPNLWTEEVWNSSSDKIKKDFLYKMDELYLNTRESKRIIEKDRCRHGRNNKFSPTNKAEEIRKLLIREHNLGLEDPMERRRVRKRNLAVDFESFIKGKDSRNKLLNKSLNNYKNLIFSANQKKKIKNIKTSGGSASTYKNLRDAINTGKNIEYEALGTSFKSIRKIFDVIVQSTNNCEKYTYIVLAVLNVCSIKESYKRQLCRFFKKAHLFVDALREGNSWNWDKSLISKSATFRQSEVILNTEAPIIGIGRGGETFKTKNENLSALITNIINMCNQQAGFKEHRNSYVGKCSGFGIDILLVSHSKLDGSDGIIATLPLSRRSLKIIKPTNRNNENNEKNLFFQNKKNINKLILYILNQLTIGTYNRNPLLNSNINCSNNNQLSDIYAIITTFYKTKEYEKLQKMKDIMESKTNKWVISKKKIVSSPTMNGGKTRKKRKTRKKKRKTRKKK